MSSSGLRDALVVVLGVLMLALGVAGLIFGWERAWLGVVLGGIVTLLAFSGRSRRPGS